jgi:hypothetical protein
MRIKYVLNYWATDLANLLYLLLQNKTIVAKKFSVKGLWTIGAARNSIWKWDYSKKPMKKKHKSSKR